MESLGRATMARAGGNTVTSGGLNNARLSF